MKPAYRFCFTLFYFPPSKETYSSKSSYEAKTTSKWSFVPIKTWIWYHWNGEWHILNKLSKLCDSLDKWGVLMVCVTHFLGDLHNVNKNIEKLLISMVKAENNWIILKKNIEMEFLQMILCRFCGVPQKPVIA